MLKSCRYCGRIHDSKYDCGKKPIYRKHGSKPDQYHSSYQWTMLSKRIKQRDHYLCQACLHGLDGEGIRYTTDNLEVHHIIPISEEWELRRDHDNLITLCRMHHEMAEAGHLPRSKLQEIVIERNRRRESIPPG